MKLSLSLSLSGFVKSVVPFVGPLDAHTSNLALALLPFRGFSSYAGAYCRVRDDGDGNTEQDISYDAVGEPVFPTLLGNGGMRWWYDQSANAYNVPQSVAASQPYLTNSVLNGYPVVRFDGIDDIMGLSMPGGAERTVYMVAKARANGSSARVWDDTSDYSSASVFFNNIANPYQYYLTDVTVSDVGGIPSAWNIITLKRSDSPVTATVSPWTNNTPATPFISSSYNTTGHKGFQMGGGEGGNFGAVDIAARLVYDVAHDDATRQAIQSILATKFGITLA